ncbi:alpha/beta hydrolase [Thermomonospora umbrina]|uniref:S-formylglutathione hydrolase FrmB n=1 Tax=Thermomonospora umbrina TaxID=111806 RepID=A0A3D9SVF2_9ACTN|nr:alpha/beta hydrolase-fold protein [Thermomonospora umbrina]REE96554.1 S-formylglutathione hydrolase FrmB [Thermomonospora umbrina]
MQLTSDAFVVLLTVAAIATVALTVWLTPKVSGSGIKHVLARLGVLVACQFVIVLALAVGINSYFLFYSTWNDLLGTTSGPVKLERGRGTGAQPAKPVARNVSEMNKASGLHDPKTDGRIEEITIRGARTGLSLDAYVYLPPQYFQPEFAARRFPVVLTLAGYPGDPRNFIERQELPKTAKDDTKAGRTQPMIYVITRTTVAPPRDTECTDVPSGPQAETFFAQDAPEVLSATYRLAADHRGWGVLGQSTGGYCAVKLAMLHSDRYAAGASLGGYLKAVKDATTGDLYGGSKLVRNDNDLLWRLEHLPPPPTSILLASSKVERDFPQARKFASLAKPPLRVDTLFPDDGGHNFGTFRRLTPEIMRWMSAQLKAG